MDTLNLNLESQRILAENIRAYIELYQIKNVEEFAIKCDCSKMQIYNILNFKSSPTMDYMDKIAKGMSITVVQLLTPGYFDQFEKKIVKKK